LGLFNFGSFGATTDLVTDSVLELTVWHLFIIYFTEAIAEVWWILAKWFLNCRTRFLFFIGQLILHLSQLGCHLNADGCTQLGNALVAPWNSGAQGL
jgi:hypothetical protein